MEQIYKSKLVVKDLGDPRKVLAKNEDDFTPLVLGVMLGHATKVFTKPGINGELVDGVKGTFEGVRADETATISSGVCWLPGGIAEMVTEKLREDNAGPVEFAFEISVRRAKNPVGYEYIVKSLINVSASDPLSFLRSQIEQEKPKQLAAPAEGIKKTKAA